MPGLRFGVPHGTGCAKEGKPIGYPPPTGVGVVYAEQKDPPVHTGRAF